MSGFTQSKGRSKRNWFSFMTPTMKNPDSGNSAVFVEALAWCEANIPKRRWKAYEGWEEIVILGAPDSLAFKLRWC